MTRILCATLLAASLAGPLAAAPSPQLTRSVADRLAFYGIEVLPERLTTAQAAALHMMLVSEREYLVVRRKARAILTNPDFRD